MEQQLPLLWRGGADAGAHAQLREPFASVYRTGRCRHHHYEHKTRNDYEDDMLKAIMDITRPPSHL